MCFSDWSQHRFTEVLSCTDATTFSCVMCVWHHSVMCVHEYDVWVSNRKEPLVMCGNWNIRQAVLQQVFRVTTFCVNTCFQSFSTLCVRWETTKCVCMCLRVCMCVSVKPCCVCEYDVFDVFLLWFCYTACSRMISFFIGSKSCWYCYFIITSLYCYILRFICINLRLMWFHYSHVRDVCGIHLVLCHVYIFIVNVVRYSTLICYFCCCRNLSQNAI